MNHKKCGNKLVLDCSHLYKIQSPSITISTKGIFPGTVQIDFSGNSGPSVLRCNTCNEEFSTKKEMEDGIVEECVFCKKEYPPSEILVSDYINKICIHCGDSSKASKTSNAAAKNLLSLYGQVLSKSNNNITLLDILTKK